MRLLRFVIMTVLIGGYLSGCSSVLISETFLEGVWVADVSETETYTLSFADGEVVFVAEDNATTPPTLSVGYRGSYEVVGHRSDRYLSVNWTEVSYSRNVWNSLESPLEQGNPIDGTSDSIYVAVLYFKVRSYRRI